MPEVRRWATWAPFYGRSSLDIPFQMLQKHRKSMGKLPSGKRLHNYGKSPFLMGKLTINGHVQ
jgi:hypothetical protein